MSRMTCEPLLAIFLLKYRIQECKGVHTNLTLRIRTPMELTRISKIMTIPRTPLSSFSAWQHDGQF
jgi:hypothetical protein